MIMITVQHFGQSKLNHKYIRNILCNEHILKIRDTIRNVSQMFSEVKIRSKIRNASEMNHKYPLRAVSWKIRNVFYHNFHPDSRNHALSDPAGVTWASSET